MMLISAFVFAIRVVQALHSLNPKFQTPDLKKIMNYVNTHMRLQWDFALNILTLISINEYPRSKFFIEKFMTFSVRAITINRLCNMNRYIPGQLFVKKNI